jgi:hypothetical protein
LKLDKDKEIEFFQEYKYLGVIFYTSGTDNKEIRSTVMICRAVEIVILTNNAKQDTMLNLYMVKYLTEFAAFRKVCLIVYLWFRTS